jgi:hypothetical protein
MATSRIRLLAAAHAGAHQLDLHFSDDSRGRVDLADLLNDSAFTPLRNEASFATFGVAHGTLVWPTFDLGLAVEFLHARANGLPEPRTRSEARANERAIAARHLTESR